jgi:cytoskeletal protein CcmA (bactofilin family)
VRWTVRKKRGGRGGERTAFVDEASEIEGRCPFSGTAVLNGTLKGEIVSSDTPVIGEKGVVHASTPLISGEVVGNVVASERVELRARVFGDVEAPVVVVEEGVLFEGHCRMARSRPAEAAPPRDLSVIPLKRER